MSGPIARRGLIRALVQTRIGPSPRARKRKWRRADRVVRASCGQCADCNEPALPDISRCAACKARHDAWDKARYEDQVADGRCHQCPGEAAPMRTLCAKCGERNRLGAKARRDARGAA